MTLSILRKLKSAMALLASKDGLNRFAKRLAFRLRERQIDARNGKPFRYRTPNGFDFACLPKSASSRHMYSVGESYQSAESTICSRWLETGDHVVDVGANIGWTATLFADSIGPGGRVVAVEPAERTYDFLKSTIEVLGLTNVVPIRAALSDSPGTVEFRVPNDADEINSDVVASMKVSVDDESRFRKESVEALTMESLVAEHLDPAKVSLIKIDVEGAEPLVLAGGRSLIDRADPPLVMFEVHVESMKNFGFTPADSFRFTPTDRFELYLSRISTSEESEFETGRLYRIDDPRRIKWPANSDVIAVPRAGAFAARRGKLAELLGTSSR